MADVKLLSADQHARMGASVFAYPQQLVVKNWHGVMLLHIAYVSTNIVLIWRFGLLGQKLNG